LAGILLSVSVWTRISSISFLAMLFSAMYIEPASSQPASDNTFHSALHYQK
jgi:hypothetical protein